MADTLYYAKGLEVWKSPVRTKIDGGESVSVGFLACTASEVVGEEGAIAIAALLCLGEQAQKPAPSEHVRVWTQKDAEREYVAFAEWFKERGYPGYPDLYPLTTENAMHSAWQEAAKRAALATTEGQP